MYFIKHHAAFCILAILFAANVFIWHAVLVAEDDRLTVAFLNVGQGDSIFIESPSGNQMLIDGGRGKQVITELRSVVPFYDRTIDVVAATHPDADHIGGLPYVLDRFDVRAYVSTGKTNDTAVFRALQKRVEEEGAQRITARAGQTIKLDADTYVDILFPYGDVDRWDSNNASLIARVVHGDTSVMLTGDASKSIEQFVAGAYGDALRSTVAKAGHHGSDTSSAATFLGFVSPETAIISAGKDNRYGHPHPDVMEQLARFDIETLSTAEEKTIIFTSDGHSFTREQ